MSDTGPIPPAHRDAMIPNAAHEGAIGALTDFGSKLAGALSPEVLGLLLINCVFLGMVMWFLNSQLDQRTALVSRLVDKCMEIALRAPSPEHP